MRRTQAFTHIEVVRAAGLATATVAVLHSQTPHDELAVKDRTTIQQELTLSRRVNLQ
jgi:hypothetical protein